MKLLTRKDHNHNDETVKHMKINKSNTSKIFLAKNQTNKNTKTKTQKQKQKQKQKKNAPPLDLATLITWPTYILTLEERKYNINYNKLISFD